MELVLDLPAGTAHARLPAPGVLGVGTAALEHELLDDPVEVQAVVEARINELQEVGHGLGGLVVVQADGDVTG